MSKYVFHYFAGRGWGEVSRQLFHIAGIPYTDNRYTHNDWMEPGLKERMPFGQMPVLEVDGQKIPQSFAIARYLANQFGYAGKTPFEAAWVDALADQYKEYGSEIRPFILILFGFGDMEYLDKTRKKFGEPARDKFFSIIDKTLEKSSSGFLVGDSLTWVDLVVADNVDVMQGYLPDFFEAYPKTVAHQKMIYAYPKLKEWIETRPKTAF